MNELDITFAIIDITMLGKLEIQVLGSGSDICYYAAVRNDYGVLLVDATERRVGDAVIAARDRIVAYYNERRPNGELILQD